MPHRVDESEVSMIEDYGHRLLPHIVDFRAKTEPTKIMASIARSPDVSKGFHEISYEEMSNAVNSLSWWLVKNFGGKGNFEAITYLGVNDHRYTIFHLACVKTGYVALLASQRNSSAHFQHLFEVTKADRLIYSSKYAKLSASLQAERPSIASFQIPELEELLQSVSAQFPYVKTYAEAQKDPVMIIHTSGSTGAPKPIYYTNSFFGVMDHSPRVPPHNGIEYSGMLSFMEHKRVFTCFPLFHLAGTMTGVGAIFFDATIVMGSPDAPATAKTTVDVIRASGSQAASLPPSISNDIVKLYRNELEQCFPTFTDLMSGGGPLTPEAGDYLTKKVKITQLIGSTECGGLALLKVEREFWDWFYFHPTSGGLVMEPKDDGLFELVIKKKPGEEETQGVFHVFPELDEWRTKDIFRKHPEKPYHQFVGRLDDVLILSNGEKFNPVGMEGIITGHLLVKGCIVVGMRKSQVALLVEKEDNAPSSDEEFIEAIWPTIQQANAGAPGQGQLYKKMILVTNPEKPFPRAGKGTIQRARAVKLYESEVEQFYKSIEGSGESSAENITVAGIPVMKIPVESVQKFVQDHMAHLLAGQQVAATEDFISLGFDSLQTTELSNNLRSGLRPFMSPTQLDEINIRTIYENPTAEKLGVAIYELMNSTASNDVKTSETGTSQKTLDSMKMLIEKYTKDLPEKAPITIKNSDKDLHVVVSGTSGYLGQYLILRLLKDPKVSKVTCFNRSADAEEKYLSKGGVKQDISRLEFLQVSFGESDFGLPTAKYEELVNTVDAVIHNAWKVDFLHSVESYEDVHIRGVANFVNWSLKSPRSAALSFISSIAACNNWSVVHPGSPVPEGVNSDLTLPGMGYGQSKFVGENILDLAARERGISCTVLRSGQIAGPIGEQHGIWNKSEWFPTLMKTSKALGLVPSTLGSANLVDWIPVDVQASIIVDAIHSALKNGPVGHAVAYNMVNPEHVAYTDLLPAIERGLDQPKPISIKEWVEELKKHDANSREELKKFPGIKLIGFYEAMVAEDSLFSSGYVVDHLRQESETMAHIKPVTGDAMASWLKQWNF